MSVQQRMRTTGGAMSDVGKNVARSARRAWLFVRDHLIPVAMLIVATIGVWRTW